MSSINSKADFGDKSTTRISRFTEYRKMHSINRILSCFAMVAVLNQLDSAPWVPYLSIICVMGYIFGFAIGPGPIPWIWNTEFFKQSARAGGASEYIYKLSEKSSH